MSQTNPLLKNPKLLLLDLAQKNELPEVLDTIVDTLAQSKQVALVRIWLKRPGQGCDTCLMNQECQERSTCLHLVSSAGKSIHNKNKYTSTNGAFRRFPLGVRKVGKIASSGKAIEASHIKGNANWMADPEWFKAENIKAFSGQPLLFKGQILGVLALFSRSPFNKDDLTWLKTIANHAASAIANAEAWQEIQTLKELLVRENQGLKIEVKESSHLDTMIGHSSAFNMVREQIELVAKTDTSVLISGESGTGKELIAREIHKQSRRGHLALIKVNCAAIPKELFESEFFGHTKGSFTGAIRDRLGRFELAHGGTLFLDEVGEIPLELQSKLLRVIQEGELEKVGDDKTKQVDVRIICATNKNLLEACEENKFRKDLYYRLNVFPINVPPLRDRTEDILNLAQHFLEKLSRKLGKSNIHFSQENLKELTQYSWPGNIRELQHIIERALITVKDKQLKLDIKIDKRALHKKSMQLDTNGKSIMTYPELRALEIENITQALQNSNNKIYGKGGAAERLQIKPTTLCSKIKSLNIRM